LQYSWPKRGGAADGYKHTESVGGMCKKKKKKRKRRRRRRRRKKLKKEKNLSGIFLPSSSGTSSNHR